jgi:hypothetical protein
VGRDDKAPALSTYTAGPCATLAREHEQRIKSIGATPDPLYDDAMREAFRCVPTKDGAWATTFESLQLAGDELKGKLALLRVDANGRRLASVIPAPVGSTWRSTSAPATTTNDNYRVKPIDAVTRVSALVVHDWDRDGQPEAYLSLAESIHEGGTRERARIWTLRSGQVVEYAPASKLLPQEVWDADGDGRLDLLSPAPFVGEVAEGPGEYPASGPLLLAHALSDGTFTGSDDLAKGVASCACPSRPDPFVLPHDVHEALTAIACARIWGVETRVITDAADAACKSKPANEGAACVHHAVREFAELTPPVRLP